MPLFQDEPEERPHDGQSASGSRRRMFAPEPEEAPRTTSNKKVRTAVPATLFGDEPDEQSESGEDCISEGDGPLQTIFNLDFSAMKLFAESRLLTKSKDVTVADKKKRAYDNSKRAEQAAGYKHKPYKVLALDPKRLPELQQKPQCKCVLVKLRYTK